MNKSLPHGVRRCHKPQNNAARERSRVKTLRSAFLELQRSLPAVPPNTKLSKLDVLVLATTYIYHLTRTLERQSFHDHHATVTSGMSGPTVSRKVALHSSPTCRNHQERNLYHGVGLRAADVALNNLTPSYSGRIGYAHSMNASRHLVAPKSGQCQSDSVDMEARSRPMEGFRIGVDAEHQSGQICQKAIGVLRPVKKWPMRSRLYDSILGCTSKGTLSSQFN